MKDNSQEELIEEPKISFKFNAQSYALVIALFLIAILFASFTGGDFLSPRNLSNLFTQMAVISVLAIGMTFVIVTAHIDLSIGSLAGLTGGIAAILHVWYDWNTGLVVLVTILIGALLGLFQGWWVAYRAVPAFIVTLGGLLIFRGMLIGLSKGQTVAPLEGSFAAIAGSYVPYGVGYALAGISIAALFFFKWRTRLKRSHLELKLTPGIIDYGKIAIYSFFIILLTYMLNRYYGIPTPMLIVIVLAGIFIFISVKTSFGRYIY